MGSLQNGSALTKNQSSTARSRNLKKRVPSGTGMVSTFVHLSSENEGPVALLFYSTMYRINESREVSMIISNEE